jgi:hypothetical protein
MESRWTRLFMGDPNRQFADNICQIPLTFYQENTPNPDLGCHYGLGL